MGIGEWARGEEVLSCSNFITADKKYLRGSEEIWRGGYGGMV